MRALLFPVPVRSKFVLSGKNMRVADNSSHFFLRPAPPVKFAASTRAASLQRNSEGELAAISVTCALKKLKSGLGGHEPCVDYHQKSMARDGVPAADSRISEDIFSVL